MAMFKTAFLRTGFFTSAQPPRSRSGAENREKQRTPGRILPGVRFSQTEKPGTDRCPASPVAKQKEVQEKKRERK